MLALLDADIIAFRCAATAEDLEEWIAIARTKELVEQILHEVKATEYKLFLGGRNNFRKEIYPEYKANRTRPLPKHLNACREYLIREWDAEVTNGYEADDALGINCVAKGSESIICSIDKDLQQIPGQHYNFVKKETTTVSLEAGTRTFYTQLLIGDAADNIKGVAGIGKAKAPKILEGCDTEEEMFEACREAYGNDELMLLNAKLIYIWQKENDNWTFDRVKHIKQEVEV